MAKKYQDFLSNFREKFAASKPSPRDAWKSYSQMDQKLIKISFVVIFLAILTGVLGTALRADPKWLFNAMAVGLICTQGFIGACQLKNQGTVSAVLTLVSLAMLWLSVW